MYEKSYFFKSGLSKTNENLQAFIQDTLIYFILCNQEHKGFGQFNMHTKAISH